MEEEKKVSIPLVVGGVALIVVVAAGGIFISLNTGEDNSTNPTGNSIGVLADAPLKTLTPTGSFKNGVYSATGSYISPAGKEEIKVELTISNNIITKVVVTPLATDSESQRYEEKFAEGISSKVIGKKLDEFQINGRLNGSSLTGTGFNDALAKIKTQAQS